ncbi:MAG: PQQ-binding-like beta-propeller repeat protein [Patescibacteria group bacterium]|jgi:nucleoid-associated protein YgaU
MREKIAFHILMTFVAVGVISLFVSNFLLRKTQDVQASDNLTDTWYMAGANLQRTSWTAAEVSGQLSVEWYKPFDAYIPHNVQLVVIDDTLYVSTSRGLYALDAITGSVKWVFPTEMSLGNSPTIVNGVAYVGGVDKRLYAIDITNGQKLWSYDGAGQGYVTNPVVVGNRVYLGNRDGYFYSIYSNDDAVNKGELDWRYNVGHPINISAAYKNSILYFAASDSFAYALNATNGTLVWKSASKLPVTLMQTWWPVIYTNPHSGTDTLIFTGNQPYRMKLPGSNYVDLQNLDANEFLGPTYGTSGEIGPRDGQQLMDISSAAAYWETPTALEQSSDPNGLARDNHKPWRRTVFVLDATSGGEVTFDINSNGSADYAPFFWTGTRSGMRYPAVIGGDNLIYLANTYFVNTVSVTRGHAVGWDIGTPYIKTPFTQTRANDEPIAFSAGGNVIYYSMCCDRAVGAAHTTTGTNWLYYEYAGIDSQAPGYNIKTMGTDQDKSVEVFGSKTAGTGYNGAALGQNGVYGYHGEQSPPIPYIASDSTGRVYTKEGNAIVVFSAAGGGLQLPDATVTSTSQGLPEVDTADITARLENEITKVIAAGHLRPGYSTHGGFDPATLEQYGDDLTDYFHNTADTVLALSNAYPHVSSGLQTSIQTYLQSEMASYSPCTYRNNGWGGASRNSMGSALAGFDLPPDVEINTGTNPADWGTNFAGWAWPPYPLYAVWKYAQNTGANPATLFTSCSGKLGTPPSDTTLEAYPEALNAWIAGYKGYVELAKLANQPYATQETELNRLLALRVSNFPVTLNFPFSPDSHNSQRSIAVARNFMFLTPELGAHLSQNISSTMLTAYNLYNTVAPYWMIGFYSQAYGESSVETLYDYDALFNAQAWILGASRQKLRSFLDAPNFVRGDMFHIQHLVSILEATPTVLPTSTPTSTPTPTVTPIPLPDASPTPVSHAPSSTVSQTSSSVAAPVCSDQDVGKTVPGIYSAVIMDDHSIRLQFSAASDPTDHYSLQFGESSGNYTYGADTIGGKGTSEYIVKSLQSGTTYYFRIRAVNGCKTGEWSNEISATTSSPTLIRELKFVDSTLTATPLVCSLYTVTSGDTLWSIAEKLFGAGEKYQELVTANLSHYPSLKDTKNINVGWELRYDCPDDGKTSKPAQEKDKSEVLGTGYELKVAVVDTNKKPVAGATVTIHSKVQVQQTDTRGIAVFKNVASGNHRVLIAYDDYKGEQAINLKGNVARFDLHVIVEKKDSNLIPVVIGVSLIPATLILLVMFFIRRT